MATKPVLESNVSQISRPAAGIAIVGSVIALLSLAILHALSPEFEPSWRMVSEYAVGEYGWVLSIMFLSWAISSWALAYAIRSQLRTKAGKIGIAFLVLAGIGEAMAAFFNVNHSLHAVAAMIGIPSLAIAAMLISTRLARTRSWLAAKRPLLWTANLTWISYVVMTVLLLMFMSAFKEAGGEIPSEITADMVLPDGVSTALGWANRFLIVVYCAWAITTAWQALKLRSQNRAS
jgi:hypothetical membrane protein